MFSLALLRFPATVAVGLMAIMLLIGGVEAAGRRRCPRVVVVAPTEKPALRQQPTIFTPDEFQTAYVRVTLPSLDFDFDDRGIPIAIWMVEEARAGGQGGILGGAPRGDGGSPSLPGKTSGFGAFGGAQGQAGGSGGQGNMGGGGRLPDVLRPRSTPRPPAGQGNKLIRVPLENADGPFEGRELVKKAMPLRMAIIAASFPYRKQLEEFQQKLRLDTNEAVLEERVEGKQGESWRAFSFRGMLVERAVVESGKPLAWQPVPIDECYKRILILTGHIPPHGLKFLVKDDPELMPIKEASRGMVMDLPPQFSGLNYPNPVSKLVNIKTTLQQRSRPEGRKQPIDHSLIRFMDPTLEPGKTYRYRIKVRMANPNYAAVPERRTDTDPRFAKERELISDWVEVPHPVIAESDSLIYAGNQAVRGLGPDQAAIQVHRWVENYRPDPLQKEPVPVGQWVIAPHVPIHRGEFIRLLGAKLPIPYKPLDSRNLSLDEKTGVDVGDESVLVDFARTEASSELLLMSPQGRLTARTDIADLADPVRRERLNDYVRIIDEIQLRKGKD